MKKMIIVGCYLLLLISLSGCVTTTTVVKGERLNPAQEAEAYKRVPIENRTPFYVYFNIGSGNILMEPGSKIVTKRIRPLGGLSPTFGTFSFWVYAYRKYENGRLDEFVGQRKFWIHLDGYAQIYEGKIFGDMVIIDYIPMTPFGYPDRWKGSFLGIIPWEAEFKHY